MSKRAGLVCLLLALGVWLASFPLGCPTLAAWVGSVTFLSGGLFGLFLALITRTRRAFLIYLCLGLACAALWPLFHAWPYADAWDVKPWPGAPGIVLNYFTVIRPCFFLLGFPYPFARLGQHGPDPLPAPKNRELTTGDTGNTGEDTGNAPAQKPCRN